MAPDLGFGGALTCAFSVSDLERSIAWYAETLGFQLLYKVDDIGWCEVGTSVEGVTIGLSQVEGPEVKGGATLTFSVADVPGARASLEELGVRFDGDTVTFPGMVSLATFFDPDGNKLMISQDLRAAAQ